MPVDITVRFSVTSDTTVDSRFRVERTLDWATWDDLGDSVPTTTTLVSSTLSSNTTAGAASVAVANGTSFGTSGFGWVDGDALIEWTGKTSNTLTGVTWHSGYGTYASGSAVVVASEYVNDLDVTPTNNAVVYRITHVDVNSNESAPAYFWYYYPPKPASNNHCVVIVNVSSDVGVAPRASVAVSGYMATDNQFAAAAGQHLDKNVVDANTETTNALGLAFFHCWKSSRRQGIGGTSDSAYTFLLDTSSSDAQATVTAATIPDRDWVLLKDIGA